MLDDFLYGPRVLLRVFSSFVILFNSVDSNCSVWYSSRFLLVMALDSEEEKCEICISDTCFSKSFLLPKITVLASVHSIVTMDIHLMFDNFGLKCALNASFCVQYVFDELG